MGNDEDLQRRRRQDADRIIRKYPFDGIVGDASEVERVSDRQLFGAVDRVNSVDDWRKAILLRDGCSDEYRQQAEQRDHVCARTKTVMMIDRTQAA